MEKLDIILSFIKAGGFLMLPLGIVSFLIWYMLLMIYPRVNRAVKQARSFPDIFRFEGNDDIIQRIKDWISSNEGIAARIADYAVNGMMTKTALRERITEARMAELSAFKRSIKVLKALVAVSPLLGLLGTVQGMVSAFAALSTEGTVSMSLLSASISKALITTQVGLVIALPGIIGIHIINSALKNLDLDFEFLQTNLIFHITKCNSDTNEK